MYSDAGVSTVKPRKAGGWASREASKPGNAKSMAKTVSNWPLGLASARTVESGFPMKPQTYNQQDAVTQAGGYVWSPPTESRLADGWTDQAGESSKVLAKSAVESVMLGLNNNEGKLFAFA